MGEKNTGSINGTLSPLARGVSQFMFLVFLALFYWVGNTVYNNSMRLVAIETTLELMAK